MLLPHQEPANSPTSDPTEIDPLRLVACAVKFEGVLPGGELTRAKGGLSDCRVWRYVSGGGVWALRVTPVANVEPGKVVWRAGVLERASSRGAGFVPAPLRTSDGSAVISDEEVCIEVSPWMPGTPLAPEDSGTRMGEAACGLSCFHAALEEEAPRGTFSRSTAFTQRQEALGKLAKEGLDTPKCRPEWRDFVSLIHASIGPATAALERVREEPTLLQPVQVDSRPEHFLLDEDRLTGLIDFGAMRIDTPWIDLARLAGELSGGDRSRREEILLLYERAACSRVPRGVIEALDLSGAVLASANWLRWIGEGAPLSGRVEVRVAELRSRLCRLADQE